MIDLESLYLSAWRNQYFQNTAKVMSKSVIALLKAQKAAKTVKVVVLFLFHDCVLNC